MRGSWLVATILLLAGCLGAAPSPDAVPPLPSPHAPVVAVMVTDDEHVPIPAARVFVHGDPQNHTTDETGGAILPVVPGPFVVRAWAPGYYRNFTQAEAGPNGSTPAHVVLERRPADLLAHMVETREGLCYLGLAAPPDEPFACLAHPECMNPRGCPTPALMSLLLPEWFQNATLRITWDTEAIPQDLAFRVFLQPNASFADGRSRFLLAGPSPLEFALATDDLGPDVTLGATHLMLASAASPASPSPVVVQQSFFMDSHVYRFFQAPPNPPW